MNSMDVEGHEKILKKKTKAANKIASKEKSS